MDWIVSVMFRLDSLDLVKPAAISRYSIIMFGRQQSLNIWHNFVPTPLTNSNSLSFSLLFAAFMILVNGPVDLVP